MSIQSPLWLIALVVLPPLVLLTVRELRRRPELLTRGQSGGFPGSSVRGGPCLVLGLAGFVQRASHRQAFHRVPPGPVPQRAGGRAGKSAPGRGDNPRHAWAGEIPPRSSASGAGAQTDALEPGVPVAEEGAEVDPDATNIGAAIQDGLAQAGSGAAPRIVLLTDGNENRGSAEAAAGVARSMGARIFPVPLGGRVQGRGGGH